VPRSIGPPFPGDRQNHGARPLASFRFRCPAISGSRRRKASTTPMGLHATYFEQSKLIRSAAEAKIREATGLNAEPGT